MRQIRPVLMASVALAVAAAGLWGCVAAFLRGAPGRGSNALLGVAITVTVLAAACSAASWALQASHRRWAAVADAALEDRALLIRTLAGAAQRRELAKTLPIRGR